MVIRGSRKLLIKQLDTSLIQENFIGARGRDAHQIGPRVMVFDADRVFGHGMCKALDHGWVLTPEFSASTLPLLRRSRVRLPSHQRHAPVHSLTPKDPEMRATRDVQHSLAA